MPDDALTERVTVLMTVTQREKVKALAEAQDRTESYIIRRLIDEAPSPSSTGQ